MLYQIRHGNRPMFVWQAEINRDFDEKINFQLYEIS